MFEVSPDTMGFLSGAAVQAPLGSLPIQPGSESDCAPVLGEPVAFSLSGPDSRLGCSGHDISGLSSPFWADIVAGVKICSDGFGIGSFFAAK